ncbi:MAG: helix-turn-helix domain-containing protein [Erysipelotrichia bacterium]|nr:helix-turn-helix domain-containing protein [Erysipelotrichia bacterium]
MKIFRDQAAILVILFNTTGYVSGALLADYSRIGIKTLKKDMDYLNGICLDNGCEIISKVGIGYQLDIYDKKLYYEFRNEVERKYYGFYFYRNAQSERIHYIIRQLLVKGGINIRYLMDKCNYSESTIRRDLLALKKKVENYQLTFVNKTNKGMYLIGDEWNVRLLLVNENYIYNNFDKVYFLDEEAIDDVFMNHHGFREMVYFKLHKALQERNYYVSYESLTNIGDMVLLALKRKKYIKNLKDNPAFRNIDLEEEKRIILSLFNSIEGEGESVLDNTELNYLAVYLKGYKVFRYYEFEKLSVRDIVSNIVDGFLNYLNGYYDISSYDMTVLRKYLCCEIAAMLIRTRFGVHVNPKLISQFKQDGLLNLDLCSLLYRYLRDNTTINCNHNDTAMLYYSFSLFAKEREKNHRIKIMVVSKNGYFVSRTMAYQFETLIGVRNSIEFIPVEYLRIKEEEIKDIAGFITDIDCLKQQFPAFPVIDSHFLRRKSEIRKAVNEIIYNSILNKDNIFTRRDIYYVDSFNNIKDIEKYIREHILTADENKNMFFKEFYKRDAVYTSKRNNMLLVNTIGDFLGRTFIAFISLRDFMAYDTDFINKIIVYNVAGKSIYQAGLISKRLAQLIHSYEFMFTGDREEDFAMIQRIMFGNN